MRTFIIPATEQDLPFIYELFESAIRFQQENGYTGWKVYDKARLQADVREGLLFKVLKGTAISGIFSICYSDPLIWREKERGDALYLHRAVLNRTFKGEKIFVQMLDWAIATARKKGLRYIRMDTWASNEKIIGYYKSYGFVFIENYTTPDTTALPEQHRNLHVALLELSLETDAKNVGTSKVNIQQSFTRINKYWNQVVIGSANGQLIKLAKGTGPVNWHQHDDQDEVFILWKGHMTIQLEEQDIELYPHDMFIVPKGIPHRPVAHGDAEFLIMGTRITSNAAGGRPEQWEDAAN